MIPVQFLTQVATLATAAGGGGPPSTTGEPIGLLLALTKAS